MKFFKVTTKNELSKNGKISFDVKADSATLYPNGKAGFLIKEHHTIYIVHDVLSVDRY